MKKILCFLIFIAICVLGQAQQDAQYTQFMYNKLSYNPAYAGSIGATLGTAIIRSQWLGLEGAPKTQVLNFESALSNNRIGLGLNLVRNTIGVSSNYNANIAYAYRFPVGNGNLGIGLQGSLRSFNTNFADERLVAIDAISTDAGIPVGRQSKTTPNFGTGVYYNDDKLYVGFSIPRLLENNIDFSEDTKIVSESVRHFYLMAGYAFKINENMDLQPQFLLKSAANVPFDMDINLNAVFIKKYALGLSYRIGGSSQGIPAESIDVLFSAQIDKNLVFGLAYDVTVSEIRDYSGGSIEAMIRYCFKSRAKEEQELEGDYLNPRFF